jgi:hypothetical protein
LKSLKENFDKSTEQNFTDVERLAHDIQMEIFNAQKYHANKRIVIDIKAMGSEKHEPFSVYTVILEK